MLRFLVFAFALGLALSGCNNSPSDPDGGATGGGSAQGGGAATGGGASTGGGAATGGGGSNQPDACVALTCQTANAACGMVSDGCGGVLNCGVCTCTATTFATDCPSRPCETATGCTNNACTYSPVTCGFDQCAACLPGADGGCDDTSLRGCGTGCAASYCDPKPTMVGGAPVYGNVCVAQAAVRCGPCGLGGLACGADGGVASCDAISIPDVNPALIECNGASPSATVIYVDPAVHSASHDGAQATPFLTLTEGLAAAAARGSKIVIIGGAPTFTAPLVVANGVSVLGGFTGAPDWTRDSTQRPKFDVPAAGLVNGALVGLSADTITATTVISNVDVAVASIPASAAGTGANVIGAVLTNAGKLTLDRVHFTVGAGQPGGGGPNAQPTTSSVPTSANGGPWVQTNGSCAATQPGPVLGGVASGPTCNGVLQPIGAGGNGGTTVRIIGGGTPFYMGLAAATGAAGGLAQFTSVWVPGPGQNGAPYTVAAGGGSPGTSTVTWVSHVPVPQGRGGNGTPGQPGNGGGGGSSGAASDGTVCRLGGGGGAGGAGGCGGLGGAGGFPGGWSLGLVISGSGSPALSAVTVAVGAGGAGGTGGSGSSGTPGAVGGAGGTSTFTITQAFLGSKGGDGSAGQAGGLGGSGASGQARGVICEPGITATTSNVSSTGPSNGFLAFDGC